MSDDGDGGTDNPAFSNDEETSYDNSASTASAGRNSETGTPTGSTSNDVVGEVMENGKNHNTFGAPRTSPEPPRDTRIELPEDAIPDKTAHGKSKQNGVHGNGNNNDVSFLNTTVTSASNNDINDKKEQIEAVNLELVSMKPYAGTNNLQTKNQEACEVPADPYEEYFVPVNEHRKCIRGEKLYVTKDKRSTSSYWRRILCWGCGLLIVAIAAIIAILAATGVILTQEATQPLLNGEKTNYGQFNEARAAGSQEYIKNPPPSPPPATSTFPPWQTTDETLYKFVPKALDGVIKIDDLEWNDDMNDSKSRVYRDVAKDIENSLVNMLRLNDNMPLIKVYSISKDGEVKFRVSQPVHEKPDDTQVYLEDKFRQNGNIISKYHVNRLTIDSLVDECYSNKIGCSHDCVYDYVEGIFMCTCSPGQSLDMSGKTCVDSSAPNNINLSEILTDNVQGRSRMPDDIYHGHHQHDHGIDANSNDEISDLDLETKSEPEPSAEFTTGPAIYSVPKSEPEPEPTAEPESQPEPHTEPHFKPDSTSEEPLAEPNSEPEPTAESKPEPSAAPKSEPEPASKSTNDEPLAEPKSEQEPSVKPKIEPEVTLEHNSHAKPLAEPNGEPEPSVEPTSEPSPSTESTSEEPVAEPKSEPEPTAESKPEPSAEPASEPEPASKTPTGEPLAEPKSEPEPSAEPTIEPEPASKSPSDEPLAEPKSQPEPAAEPTSEQETALKSPTDEPLAEPKREPTTEPNSDTKPSAEPNSEPEPSAEPNSEPEPEFEPTSEKPIAESEPSVDPKGEPDHKPEPTSDAKPSAEPNTEPVPSAEPNSEPEPEFEPASEKPIAEPESTTEPKSESEPSVDPKGEPDHEPEPSEEPIAEPKREPEQVVETTKQPYPSMEPKSEPELDTESKNVLKLTAEAKSELEPKIQPEPAAKASSKSVPTAESKGISESAAEPESKPVKASEPTEEYKTESRPFIAPSSIQNPADQPTRNESELMLEPVNEKSTVKSKSKIVSAEPVSEVEQTIIINNSQVQEPWSDSQLTRGLENNLSDVKSENVFKSNVEIENESELPITTNQPESDTEASAQDQNKNSTSEKNLENGINILNTQNESQDEPEINSTESVIIPTNKLQSSTQPENLLKISTESISDSESSTESTILPDTPSLQIEEESPVILKEELENFTHKDNQEQLTIPRVDLEATILPESKTQSTIESTSSKTNELDAGSSPSTTPLSEIPTVLGLNEKEVSIQFHQEQQFSTEMPTQEYPSTELKDNSFLDKKYVKKAPRLDKDEQDNPNPFEINVKDVITSTINEKGVESTTYDISGMDNKARENANVPTTTFSSMNEDKKNEHENILPNLSNKKNEENAEDQYNDITDETIPKGFEKNDIEISQNIKKDEKKVQKVYKDNKTIDYKISKIDDRLNKSSESTSTVIDSGLEKHSEDQSMTSQVPILPIEIQMDMSTAETTESVDTPATSQNSEKEIISTTILPKNLHTDGKTTEQIPILPEELQTTDINKQELHTESTLVYQIQKRLDELTSDTDDTDLLEESSKTDDDRSLKTNTTNQQNIAEESTTFNHNITEVVNTLSNDTLDENNNSSTADIIKPVSETIPDDTTPINFEYKFLLTTTTEKSELSNEFEELTEEQLRVVPLEERDEFHKKLKSDDPQIKVKKEKELNFETTGVNIENLSSITSQTSEVNNSDTKTSRNVEDDNIPKLTSGASSSNQNPKVESETDVMSTLNDSKHESDINKDTNLKVSTIQYPNFIPVSEEIDETDFTEASVMPPFHTPNVSTSHLPQNINEDTNVKESDEKPSSTLTTDNIFKVENDPTLSEDVIVNSTTGKSKNNENIEAKNKQSEVVFTTMSNMHDVNSENLGIPVAILTSEDIAPQIFFSKCKSGQFQCVNGTSRDGAYCVSLSAKCDSENDCSDGSDEVNCEQEGCPGNFQCASGQCLKRHLVCNGIVDCNDGSDEKECTKWTCNFDEFQCPNGRCIPVLWQCDGRPDCENHADEYSCSESCGNDEYLCPIEKWCIPQTWRCNGVSECVNGEDEKLCECAVDQYKCETGGCIPAEQICDGVENCPDRSDEWNCLSDLNKNTSMSTESNTEKDEFSTRSSLLKIRQSSGDSRFICADGWTEEFSDQYCRSLGFSSSESTQYMEQGTNENLLQLTASANPNSSLVINLEKVNSCKSEKIVEVSCQEFSCGSHENVGPTARLVGGTPASEGQWSSVALLKEPKYGAACTASVLSPMHALASYSCIYRQSSGWQLFVGGNLLKPFKVKNIVPYPQVKYNQFLYNNDIALVELAEPLIFSRNVSAVCLPSQSFQPRQLCVTAGWGFPVNGEVDLQQYLKFLPVPTYDSEECNATSHYAGFITKHNICAGFTDTDKGPCYNDEGAPLMCVSETGRWEIQGLLSHHSRCSRGHPAIYSSLAPALSWLRNSVPALQAHS